MDEEKKGLPQLKELLEQMYRVKIEDPTPEELAHIRKILAEYQEQSKGRKHGSTDGREDT